AAAPAPKPAAAPAKPTASAAPPLPQAAPAPKAAPTPRPAPPSAPQAPVAHAPGANRVFSSPLARRLAKEAGIELGRIQGSGPHGRVIARDVEAAKSGKGLAPAAAPGVAAAAAAPAVQAPSDDKIRALFEPGSYEVVPHDNIRKVIARRL